MFVQFDVNRRRITRVLRNIQFDVVGQRLVWMFGETAVGGALFSVLVENVTWRFQEFSVHDWLLLWGWSGKVTMEHDKVQKLRIPVLDRAFRTIVFILILLIVSVSILFDV